jgi:hypothetical protein
VLLSEKVRWTAGRTAIPMRPSGKRLLESRVMVLEKYGNNEPDGMPRAGHGAARPGSRPGTVP